MKEFLLGMLSMYFALSFVGWWAEMYCDKELDFFKIPYLVYEYSLDVLVGFPQIIPFIPLCIKYRINPFWTSLGKIKEKLDDEGKEKWLSKVKNQRELKKWKEVLDK